MQRGMLVRDVFLECGHSQVQALPYGDATGRIHGRVTIKHILLLSCLPEYMIEMAPVLGNVMSSLENVEDKAREMLCKPIEPFIQELPKTINSEASLIKALAIMQKHDTSYIFVVDEGLYQGVITIQNLAARMSELNTCAAEYGVHGDKGEPGENVIQTFPEWGGEP
jgi:CBS domain containing-hemolysin-like protein